MTIKYSEPNVPGGTSGKKPGGLEKGCIGCAVGCGSLILVMVLVAIGAVMWLAAPAKTIPAQSAIGPEDKTFVVVHFDPGHPGTASLMMKWVTEAQKNSPNQRQFQSSNPDQLKALQSIFPKTEIAVASAGSDDLTTMVSLGGFKGAVKLIYEAVIKADKGETTEDYQGKSIATKKEKRKGSSSNSCLIDNTLLFSNSLPSIKRAIDHVLNPPAAFAGTGGVKSIYDRLDASKPVAGVVTNEGEMMMSLLTNFTGDKDSLFPMSREEINKLVAATERMGFTVDVISSDSLGIIWLLDCYSDSMAASAAKALQHQGKGMERNKQAKDFSVKVSGKTVTYSVTLINIDKRIEAISRQHSGQRSSPATESTP